MIIGERVLYAKSGVEETQLQPVSHADDFKIARCDPELLPEERDHDARQWKSPGLTFVPESFYTVRLRDRFS